MELDLEPGDHVTFVIDGKILEGIYDGCLEQPDGTFLVNLDSGLQAFIYKPATDFASKVLTLTFFNIPGVYEQKSGEN